VNVPEMLLLQTSESGAVMVPEMVVGIVAETSVTTVLTARARFPFGPTAVSEKVYLAPAFFVVGGMVT